MKIWIEKELFQWEKNREVFIEQLSQEPKVTYVQFYNSKSERAVKADLKNGRAMIPNALLKEKKPIMVLACIDDGSSYHVIARKEFKVIARVKPENYVEDIIQKEVIYDGGEEL